MPLAPSVSDLPAAVPATPPSSLPPAPVRPAAPSQPGLAELCFHRLAAPLSVGLLLGWLFARPWARIALASLLLPRGEFASDPAATAQIAVGAVLAFFVAVALLGGIARVLVTDLMADAAVPGAGDDCPARALPLAVSMALVGLASWTALAGGLAGPALTLASGWRLIGVLLVFALLAAAPAAWWWGLPALERRGAERGWFARLPRWLHWPRLPAARPGALLVTGLALALVLDLLPVAATRLIGTPAVLVGWAAIALAVVGALTLFWRRAQRRWLGEVRGTMLAALLLLVWAGGFDPLAEAEGDEALPPVAPALPATGAAPQRDFARMRLDTGDVFVSAHGGGFGAALATGLTLAEADDLACGRFAPRLRTLSAVSGGAVGAGVYLVFADAFARLDLRAACVPGAEADRPLMRAVGDVLRQDHLAPVLARLPFDLLLRRATRGQALLDSLQLSVRRRLDRLADAAPIELPNDWRPTAVVASPPVVPAPARRGAARGRGAEPASVAPASPERADGIDTDALTLGNLIMPMDRVDDAMTARWTAQAARNREQRLRQAERVAAFDRAGLAVPLTEVGRRVAPALDLRIQLADAGGAALWLGNGGSATLAARSDANAIRADGTGSAGGGANAAASANAAAVLAQPADLSLGRALLDAVRFQPWLPAGSLVLGTREFRVTEGGGADPNGLAGLAAALAPGARGIWLDIDAPAADRVHAPGDDASSTARDRFALPAVGADTAARGAIVGQLADALLAARNPHLLPVAVRFGDTVAPGCQPATTAAALAVSGLAAAPASRCADR